MLTLRRRKTEEAPGLTRWLISEEPVERQYAEECLAEMGDIHGTEWLILLASTEDKNRRKNYVIRSVVSWGPWLACCIFSLLAETQQWWITLTPCIFLLLSGHQAKGSQLQQRAVEKLAEGQNPAALGVLVDALWRAEIGLKVAAKQGLVRLLPRAGKNGDLSKYQWDLLLDEIEPKTLSRQKAAVDTKFVIAILKAAVAADYFPAASRIKKLSETQEIIRSGNQILPVAVHCYAVLAQARLTQLSSQGVGKP